MSLYRSWKACILQAATVAVVASISAPAAHAVNLLTNPGFESPPGVGGADSTIAGWSIVDNAQRANFANHTTGGSESIWYKTFLPDGGAIQQTVGITGGAAYTFSGFNYFEGSYPNVTPPNTPTPAVITQSVTWLDSGGNSVGTPASVVIDPSVSPPATGTWIPYSLVANAPATAVSARISGGWIGGGAVPGAQSAFWDDVVFDGPGTPPPPISSDWVPTGSGDWNVGTNWLTGTVPNGIDATANLVGSITAPHTVYSDTAITVGSLKFNNANQYVIAGAGSLTMDVTTGSAAINVLQGSHKINLPLRLNDSTVATIATGATLTIADPLTLANGSTLSHAGGGTLEIISTTTTLGGSSIIATNAGTTNLRMPLGGSVALSSVGGSTVSFATQRVTGVSITGGTVALDSLGSVKVLDTNSLTIAGGASPAGKLDIGDNGVIVRGGSSATIRSLIIAGRAAGGNGITTSANTPGGAVGYANSSQVPNLSSNFLGEAYSGAAVLVRFTLAGDANLDGTVNFNDLVTLAQNYGLGGKEWVQGDFNYDGSVNFNDLVPLAQNYNGVINTAALVGLGGEGFANDWKLAAALAPEPTMLSLIGLGAMVIRRRRTA